jgi:ParB family chromosome partitioning protein
MTSQRKALGRGIEALIPGAGPNASQPAVSRPALNDSGTVADTGRTLLPVDQIIPNPDQPRRSFDPEHLERLSNSIQLHGVIQPIVVRRTGSRYELICGEQRWRAAELAGLESIPAVVSDVAEGERLQLALIENVQRADLNPIELAHAFHALGAAGATQEEIGRRVSLDRSTISNHLRLLELPREHQADVEAGRLTIGHAKALLTVNNPERRSQLRDRIVRDSLSVRAAEALARETSAPISSRKTRRGDPRPVTDPNLLRLVDTLRQRMQTRVRINGDAERGRLEIEYFGSDDLTRIIGLLMGDH